MYDRMRVCPQGCGVAVLLHPAQSYTGCTVLILCTIKKKRDKLNPEKQIFA